VIISYVALPNCRRQNVGHLMCIDRRPASTLPQSVLSARTAKNPKPSRRRPNRLVSGQVPTSSRRVASCFQRCLVEKPIFRRSPIIARSPCTFHGQVSRGGGRTVYKGGFMVYGRTLWPNIALFPARLQGGRQTNALSAVNHLVHASDRHANSISFKFMAFQFNSIYLKSMLQRLWGHNLLIAHSHFISFHSITFKLN
jgi:hypothetical protein